MAALGRMKNEIPDICQPQDRCLRSLTGPGPADDRSQLRIPLLQLPRRIDGFAGQERLKLEGIHHRLPQVMITVKLLIIGHRLIRIPS